MGGREKKEQKRVERGGEGREKRLKKKNQVNLEIYQGQEPQRGKAAERMKDRGSTVRVSQALCCTQEVKCARNGTRSLSASEHLHGRYQPVLAGYVLQMCPYLAAVECGGGECLSSGGLSQT